MGIFLFGVGVCSVKMGIFWGEDGGGGVILIFNYLQNY